MVDLGVEVSVIEAGPRILPTESKSIAKALQNDLEQRGVNFLCRCQLSEEHVSTKDNSLKFKSRKNYSF